jgi:hypothetical protein
VQWPENAAAFIANFGLELLENYPYLNRESKCPQSPDTPIEKLGHMKANIEEFLMIDVDYIEEYLNEQPLLADLNTNDDFYAYGGGVFEGETCKTRIEHALLIVGHGRLDGEEYWLLRNTWSDDWGEKGFMKLNKNSDCIIMACRYNLNGPKINVHLNRDVAKMISPADLCPVQKA